MLGTKTRRAGLIIAFAGAFFLTCAGSHAQQSKGTEKLKTLPPPLIAVIDFKKAVEDSEAGKNVRRQVNERHTRIQKEIAKSTAELEKTKQELERQRAIYPPEEFKTKWRDFQVRVQQYRKSVQIEQKKLDLMMRHNMLRVEAKLAEVLRDMAQELGANVVIDAGPGRGSVLFADAALVVTEEATKRLNKAMPTIDVEEPQIVQKPPPQTPRLQAPKEQ